MAGTRARVLQALIFATVALGSTGCGGGDAPTDVTVEVPADATFCSVFEGEYRAAIANAVPATDAGFDESAGTITAWAVVVRDLAPAEIADLADDNVSYHEAQANKESASDFIPGSNEMHAWANANC